MRKTKLTDEYLSDLCMQLSLLIGAGVAPQDALDVLRGEERDGGCAAILESAGGAMAGGSQLHEALRGTGAFPRYLTDLTELGERTGNLEPVLRSLAGHYGRQAELAEGVRGAVAYPAALLAMMLAVTIVLLVKVLPVFRSVYAQLGVAMSGPAAVFLRWGLALRRTWPVIPAALAVIAATLWLAARAKKKRTGSRWAFLPASLRRKTGAERFASAMAMALRSGFDTDAAMEMAERLCADGETEQTIRAAREKTAAGASFSGAMEETGLFTPTACRLMAVGVRTGGLDAALEEIAARLGRQVDDGMDAWISRIEPTLVIVLCALIGLILLSVMLPLAGLLSAMG